MKKQLIYILGVALLLGVTVSCEENISPSPIPKTFYKSYIDAFIKCDSLNVRSSDGVAIDKVNKICYRIADTESQENIIIYIFGIEPSNGMDYPTNIYYSRIWNKNDPYDPDHPHYDYYHNIYDQYDKYIKTVDDIAYNREVSDKRRVVVSLSALKEVKITSDKKFNNNFLVGTDLSPLFYIVFDDVYATVKSGYKAAQDTYRYRPDIFDNNVLAECPMSVRCLKLSETNLEKYSFTEAKWELFLDAKPEKTDSYTFHIKLIFADGTVLEGDAPAITIKGVE